MHYIKFPFETSNFFICKFFLRPFQNKRPIIECIFIFINVCISLRARLVFDQSGAFCRFGGRQKKYFQKNQKRRLLAGSERLCVRLVSGKGETHLIPPGKGVKRWI